jgi:hypothetical protein
MSRIILTTDGSIEPLVPKTLRVSVIVAQPVFAPMEPTIASGMTPNKEPIKIIKITSKKGRSGHKQD